jgi:hypothetical protein
MTMTWSDLGYGLSLTIIVGSVLAFLLLWRDARDRRAADLARRRLDQPTAQGHHVHGRHIGRAA